MASSIIPGVYHEIEIDDKVQVSTDDAYEMVYGLGQLEGILVGQSSGAAMVAALKFARSLREGCVVTVFPDFGDKYLSTNLWIGWQAWRRERMQRFMEKWNVPASAIT
jgi:cysteine synthase